MTLTEILLAWFAVSVIVSPIIGALIRAGKRDDEVLARLRKAGL